MSSADHLKYHDPEYSDTEIDALMNYFHLNAYRDIVIVLKIFGIRK